MGKLPDAYDTTNEPMMFMCQTERENIEWNVFNTNSIFFTRVTHHACRIGKFQKLKFFFIIHVVSSKFLNVGDVLTPLIAKSYILKLQRLISCWIIKSKLYPCLGREIIVVYYIMLPRPMQGRVPSYLHEYSLTAYK